MAVLGAVVVAETIVAGVGGWFSFFKLFKTCACMSILLLFAVAVVAVVVDEEEEEGAVGLVTFDVGIALAFKEAIGLDASLLFVVKFCGCVVNEEVLVAGFVLLLLLLLLVVVVVLVDIEGCVELLGTPLLTGVDSLLLLLASLFEVVVGTILIDFLVVGSTIINGFFSLF